MPLTTWTSDAWKLELKHSTDRKELEIRVKDLTKCAADSEVMVFTIRRSQTTGEISQYENEEVE